MKDRAGKLLGAQSVLLELNFLKWIPSLNIYPKNGLKKQQQMSHFVWNWNTLPAFAVMFCKCVSANTWNLFWCIYIFTLVCPLNIFVALLCFRSFIRIKLSRKRKCTSNSCQSSCVQKKHKANQSHKTTDNDVMLYFRKKKKVSLQMKDLILFKVWLLSGGS